MPTNAQAVKAYLDFALLQLGAESYLHGADFGDARDVGARWKYGFNDPTHPFIDPEYVDPRTGQKTGRAAPGPNDGFDEDGTPLFGPNKTVLPAYNRMVGDQARDLFRDFQVIDQHADDATGFSATLFKNRSSGEYTLSFRSTEFRAWETAGDNPRDNEGGNQEGIRKSGFAFAQLASMEDYWRHIRNGERWHGRPNQAGGAWVADTGGALGAFKQYMDSKPAGKGLFVTGYSLGGHLANVFTLIHEAEVEKTYVYNGAGHGIVVDRSGSEIAGGTTGAKITAMLAVFTRALTDPASIMLPDQGGFFDPLAFLQRKAIASASRLTSPFVSENGLTTTAQKGNVYDASKDGRYAFAARYLASKYPTSSLSTSLLGATFGVSYAVLTALFQAGLYANAARRIQKAPVMNTQHRPRRCRGESKRSGRQLDCLRVSADCLGLASGLSEACPRVASGGMIEPVHSMHRGKR